MIEADLHLHTTFSDGALTPTQLVELCASSGLKHAAVTDHDSTEGVPEALQAARRFPDLDVIVGVELSADVPGSEIHLLGYFVDHEDEAFQRTLAMFRDGREERARRMVERLEELGAPVSWTRVQELSGGGAIGRPHVAKAMVEAGHVQQMKDAFDAYLGRNGPAYVERARLTPVEAVQMLAAQGAVPVMAHPTFSIPQDAGVSSPEGRRHSAPVQQGAEGPGVASVEGANSLRRILAELKEAGLAGMEVFYGRYTPDEVNALKSLADEMGLIPCGGSDYHATGALEEARPGDVGPPASTVEALLDAADSIRGSLSRPLETRPEPERTGTS